MDVPRSLIDDVPAALYEADARTGEPLSVSRHVELLLGRPAAWWVGNVDAWRSVVHADDLDDVLRGRGGPLGERDEFELTYRAFAADGRLLWLQDRARVVRGPGGGAHRLRGALWDVTEYQLARDRDRFLTHLDRELQQRDGAEDVMAVATRTLGEHLRVDRCAYAQTEPDENHFLMSGDHATGLPPLPGRFAMREFGDGALRAMRAGEPWVVTDSENDPRLGPEDLAAYRVTGIKAVICLPLLRGGRFAAAMAVHQAVPRQWTRDEVDLVSTAVNRCWESLQRVHADQALRDSEERNRVLVERATDAILILDRDLRFVEVNPAACALLGPTRDELLGTPVSEWVGDDVKVRLHALVADVSTPRSVTEVWDLRRADGTAVAVELSIQTTRGGVQAIGRDVTERLRAEAERLRAEAERELLLHHEHEIAEILQHSLLPRELPPLERLSVSARYLPASTHGQIGGDWYEVLSTGDTTVALTVGDVVGKGPTAAAVMGQLRSALATYLLDGHSPAEALERLDAFAARVEGAVGSSCACLTFDWSTGLLRWSIAGHPPPLVVERDTVRLLPGHGAVLGFPGRAPYTDRETALAPGSSVVLYTDGLVESPGHTVDDGIAELAALVVRTGDQDARTMVDTVVRTLLADGQNDDVALVIARHIPPPLHRTVPAVPGELSAVRRHAEAWARAAGLSADLVGDLQLALGEAVANAVDHAYPDSPGEFDYRIRHTVTGVEVTVRDRGRWRPPPADPGTRGRGLRIIHALADTVVLDNGDSGTSITFHLPHGDGVPPSARPLPATDTADLVEDPHTAAQVLRLTGDLDTDTAPGLRSALLSAVDRTDDRAVELDLTDLGYLSSSGVALILDAVTAAGRRQRSFAITTTPGSPPARILAMSGLAEEPLAGDGGVRTT